MVNVPWCRKCDEPDALCKCEDEAMSNDKALEAAGEQLPPSQQRADGKMEYGNWEPTPWWLRMLGFQRWRRWTVLNAYHVFSEWEYSDHPEPQP